MSDDLVKQLRVEALIADEDWTGIYQISPNLAFAAANRIEKLEAELHHCFHRIEELQAALREIAEDAEDEFASAKDMGWIARKALEGKDD